VACRTFIALNGMELEASAEEKYLNILALAEGHLDFKQFADWLRAHLRPQGGHSVQEPAPGYRKRSTSKAGS
jgi:death-on-curing protein